MSKQIAEAEVKLEISKEEFDRIDDKLRHQPFEFKDEENLEDYYLTKEKSQYGGWDFERLRSVNDKIFYQTIKKWQMADDSRTRIESEKEISAKEFKKLLQDKPAIISLSKKRFEYVGKIEDHLANISVDILIINNSCYYFLEGEVAVSPVESAKWRQIILDWMNNYLNITNREESPSMLDIIEKYK